LLFAFAEFHNLLFDILCVTQYNSVEKQERRQRLGKNEIVAGFSQELRRGTVILCVLANLAEPAYGYSLIERLSKTGVSVEANTLYPLLRRLESQELLSSEWNTLGAKPRKYYAVTAFGKEVLAELKSQWQNTVESVNDILDGSAQ
jgi:DNA-binding PadR family transcriptional regulator